MKSKLELISEIQDDAVPDIITAERLANIIEYPCYYCPGNESEVCSCATGLKLQIVRIAAARYLLQKEICQN